MAGAQDFGIHAIRTGNAGAYFAIPMMAKIPAV